jgi:hypothetical protein
MFKLYKIYPSDNPKKRYRIYVEDWKNKRVKKIEFGSSLHENYNMHGDKERLRRYIQRHKQNEDWTDYTTAGFWSRWLLWNERSRDIDENLEWVMENKMY